MILLFKLLLMLWVQVPGGLAAYASWPQAQRDISSSATTSTTYVSAASPSLQVGVGKLSA